MLHEDLKRAVLQAQITDGDVALHALDRIDRDTAFRDALAAVVASGDQAAVAQVVYAHITPADVKRRTSRAKSVQVVSASGRLACDLDAKAVAQLINDRALAFCAELLTDNHLEAELTKIIARRFEALVCGVLGLERRFGNLEISDRTAVGKRLAAMIEERAAPILEQCIEAALDTIDFEAVGRTVAESLRYAGGYSLNKHVTTTYRNMLDQTLSAACVQRAKALAEIDAQKLLDAYFAVEEASREQGNK